MVRLLGDFTPGKTIRARFNTHQATGAPITLAGSPAISVYKGSTTESTAGVTLTVDYDGRTGMHDVVIDTSADGTFYAAGNDFDVVITAGTVDSVSVVGTVVGTFSLANRSALRPTTADRTLDVSSGGEAGVDWANVGSPTTTVGLSGTTIGTLTTYTGNTPQTGDSYAIVNSGVHGNAAIKGYVDDIGTAGAGLTAIPWNAAWDAEVQSEVQDALEANNLDHFMAAAVTNGDVANNSALAKLASKSGTAAWSSFDNTTDALEALRDRGDAAWTTATGFSTHTAADVWAVATRTLTSAANITSTGGTTVPQTGDSFARLGAPAGLSVSADVAAVKTDTGNLVTRITSTLFSGITSLAQWLGLLAGKQTGDSTARTELRATGAGSGTFDETTDSQEALRDRGDAAWTTATGFSTHTAADVWAAGTRTLTAFGFSVTVGTNNDKAGYSLAAGGLDAVTVETGLNARQALAVIAAASAGVLAGATSLSITIAAAGVPATNRIIATVDEDQNRTAVSLNLPA